MRALRVIAGAFVLGFAVMLSACSPTPEPVPIEVNVNDLQGDVVTVEIGQILYVDTSALDADVESYTAEIADESIADFGSGRNAGDFATYPRFTALSAGRTDVTMTGGPDGMQPLEFTIEVTGGR